MTKKSKWIYIIGSIVIGVVALLTVLGVLIAGGFVNVEKRKIVIESKSHEFTFNGAEQAYEEWEIIDGKLKNGHTAVVTVTGKQKDVGESENFISAKIVDENDADVSDYYDIEYQVGKLTVIPSPLHVVSDNRTKEYDGTQLEGGGYFISNGSIPADYELRVEFNNSITEAGSASNSFTASVYDSLGNDKSSSFALSTSFGALTVTPRPLKVQSASDTKEYDGTLLQKEELTVVEGSVVEGQTLTATYGSGITGVGTAENAFMITVTDENGADKSANYSVTYMNGTLTVTPRQISLSFLGAQKEYDGTPLTREEYIITSGSVAPNQNLTVTYEGTQTEKGSSKNVGSIAVTDEAGNNVLSNYQAELTFGDLVVTPRALTLVTGTADKEYDGDPLTKDSYEVESGSLAPNQSLEIEITGSRTEIGEAANAANARVIDEAGVEVTSNYNLTVKEGMLTVKPRAITVKTSGATKEYDGSPLTESSWTHTSGNLVLDHALEVTTTGSQTEVGSSKNTATVVVKNGANEIVTQNYQITVEEGDLTVTAIQITVKIHDATKVYDGLPLTSSEYEITSGNPYAGDTFTVATKGSQTEVGSSKNTATVIARNGAGENVSSRYEFLIEEGRLTVTPREIVITTQGGEKEYDGNPLTESSWTHTSGNLVLGHALEVTATGSQTEVGSSKNTATVVVKDGTGNAVTQNYNVQLVEGTLTVKPRNITVTIASDTKPYDGTPLTKDDYVLTSGQLYTNDSLEVTVEGSQTNVGVCVNRGTVVVFDQKGNNVSHHYNVTVIDGTLRVKPRAITVTTEGASKTYDGTPLAMDKWTHTGGELVLDHALEVTTTGSQTEVGSSKNTATVVVKNGANEIVTQNYQITVEEGDLTVTAIQITVKIHDATKVYDGAPLTSSEYEITSGNPYAGDTFTVTTKGSQTEVGSSKNTATVIARNGAGENVSSRYEFLIEEGKLTVTPREIVITTQGGEKEYDGNPLTESSWTHTSGNLVLGHELEVTATGSQTEVGNSKNTATVVVKDGAGNAVTQNYQITVKEGDLTVTAIQITVKIHDATKVYDGSPLTSSEYEITSGNPYAGDTFTVTTKGSQTDVGYSVNAATVIARNGAGENVNSRYEFLIKEGILTVTPRKIEIKTNDASKPYDGSPLTESSWMHTSGNLALGHELEVTTTGSQTKVGKSSNFASTRVIDGQGVDVSKNYKVTYAYGTLEVLPRVIAIETEGGSKSYDGTPLTGGYNLVSGNVLSQHTLTVTTLNSIVNVGTVANKANVVVTDENGVDVSENYQFEIVEGILKIDPRRLYVSTETKSKTYDGQILQSNSFTYAEDSPQLINGHTITTEFAYLLDAGTAENAILQYVVKNGEEDVTANYELIGNWGRLTVRVRSITIQTGSAAKDYDGQPLTCDDWELIEITPLVEGHTMEVAVIGSRTEIGEAANSVGAYVIYDANENDVTYNYAVNVQSGALVVRDPSKANDGQTEEDLGQSGAPGSGDLGGGSPNGETVTVLRIQSDTSGRVYLRYNSFGDYTGTGFADGVEYGVLLNGTHSANYLPSYAMQERGFDLSRISIDIYGGGYYLSPYYEGVTNPYPQTSDIYAQGNASEVYTLWYYAYDYLSDGGLVGSTSLSGAELAYRQFVNNQYLSVPANTAAYLNAIIAEKELSRSDPYVINAVANYIRNAAEYDTDYLNTLVDGKTLDQQSDCVVSFLRDYQVGVCRHYAAAATMMFRCLGIPARYVGGYVASAKAGEWVEVTNKEAHAWTEVYIDGFGWVAVEVTGSSYGGGLGEDGEDDVGSNVLKVRPFNRYFLYDGVHSFQYDLKTLQGLSEFTEEKGFTYTFVVEGSASAIGLVDTKITDFVLYKDGVDVTNQYQFQFGTGKLQVYCFEITVTTEGATKVYDGKPLTVDGYSVSGGENGHVVQITPTGSITDVGKKSNTFTIRIYEGEVDVTDMYKINSQFGSLEVTPIEITVTAASDEKKQDGTSLTNGNYTLAGTLAEGHTVKSVIVNGTVVRPGRADNVVGEVIIVDENGNDVTKNYVIHKVNGTLTIRP